MSDPRTAIVAAGYDAMIDTWESWKAQVKDDVRAVWHGEILTRLPPGARVVELGCGGGTEETVQLAQRFQLMGVDLSGEQLKRARKRVPAAEFIQADFTEIDFPPGSVDGVVAYYSFNHVPRDLLPRLFASVHNWLVPGGLFMTALGTSDCENWTGDWLGEPNYFSSFVPETNSRLLIEAGFELLRDEVVTILEPEPEGKATFQWVLARR